MANHTKHHPGYTVLHGDNKKVTYKLGVSGHTITIGRDEELQMAKIRARFSTSPLIARRQILDYLRGQGYTLQQATKVANAILAKG